MTALLSLRVHGCAFVEQQIPVGNAGQARSQGAGHTAASVCSNVLLIPGNYKQPLALDAALTDVYLSAVKRPMNGTAIMHARMLVCMSCLA